MKVYGQELRELALAALERGEKRHLVAQMFGMSVPTLDRWRREQRQRGQAAPRARGHKRCAFGASDSAGHEVLKELLNQAPDATLEEHLRAWRAKTGHSPGHSQGASRASLARAVERLGWTRKKRV